MQLSPCPSRREVARCRFFMVRRHPIGNLLGPARRDEGELFYQGIPLGDHRLHGMQAAGILECGRVRLRVARPDGGNNAADAAPIWRGRSHLSCEIGQLTEPCFALVELAPRHFRLQ